MKVVDGKGAVLGRLASQVARMLLEGETVHVINAEHVIISGNREDIYERYKQRVDLTDRANPRKAPKYPRTPHGIVKRAIRGMLPRRTKRGRDALKRLRVWIGDPGIEGERITVKTKTPRKYITVGELSKWLGAKW